MMPLALLLLFVVGLAFLAWSDYRIQRSIDRLDEAIRRESGGDVHKAAAMWRDVQRRWLR